MRYAIIENEDYALQNLKAIVEQIRPDYSLVFTAESVEESVEYFSSHPQLDLVFIDIELSDSNCFSIFEKVEVETPVIFTTAYDDYALRAFKVNSVDYLLKPIGEKEVRQAIEKFERNLRDGSNNALKKNHDASSRALRRRILISLGNHYSYVNIADVLYFIREDKYVNAVLRDGYVRITDFQNLTEVLDCVDNEAFFLISRNVVAHIDAIGSVCKWFNGRLNVTIGSGEQQRSIVISSSRKKDFLDWLGGK